jgi:hypothetical protein
MDPQWAAKHLLVIRTLMERAALYRQALAPVMLSLGVLGLASGALGWWLDWHSHRSFVGLWLATGLAGLCWTYLCVRRQALQANEPFWSSPARRVTQALLPPLTAGLLAGGVLVGPGGRDPGFLWWLPAAWMVLYGCAMHAAGFFMPRGMKLFGWLFIAAGGAMMTTLCCLADLPPLRWGHLVMGGVFGGFHLAYGIYLRWTETPSGIV